MSFSSLALEFISEAVAYGSCVGTLAGLVLLARGPLARYFPLFLYLLVWLGVAGAEWWIYESRGITDGLYFEVYWGGELLIDLISLLLVISLTARALEGNPAAPKLVRLLTIALAAIVLLPFVLFDTPKFGRHWNQSVAQLFNFGAAVMDFGLWTALIATKRRDPQLLKVSAGLGLTVTAAAMFFGLRQFTSQGDVLRAILDWTYRVSQLGSSLIWCWAFWPVKRSKPTATPIPIEPTA